MTPEEKKLYALMAVAEQQQNLVNQAVKELQITEERIQKVIAGQTHSTVSKSLNTGLQEGTAELIKTAKALGRLNNSIDSVIHQWSWKLIAIVLGAFAILMLAMTWLFVVYQLNFFQAQNPNNENQQSYLGYPPSQSNAQEAQCK